jgi:hypothetical protein
MPETTEVVEVDQGLVARLLAGKLGGISKKEREEVQPGEYPVDAVLRVVGTVKVGEDYEIHRVEKLDPWFLLYLAIDRLNGVTLERLAEIAAGKLDASGKLTPEAKKELKKLKDRTEGVMAKLKGKTLETNKGKVTVKGHMTIVEHAKP